MDKMNATEIVSRFVATANLKVGCLAVFTDYKGREIGCTVTRIDAGQVWCRVAGLATWQGPYKIGDTMVMDADKVRPAF